MRGLRGAFALLTRVPVRGGDAARAPAWFAVVGAAVGAAVAGVYAAGFPFLGARAAAYTAVAGGIVLTGGLHEDGLADLADALGAHVPRARRLEILKDPRVGAFGAIAIVLSVALRAEALSRLAPAAALAALVAAHAAARAAPACVLAWLPPASSEGLGASLASAARPRHAVVNVACAGAASAVLGLRGAYVVAATAAGAAVCTVLALRALGGHTGDVLGAAEQCAETCALLAASAA